MEFIPWVLMGLVLLWAFLLGSEENRRIWWNNYLEGELARLLEAIAKKDAAAKKDEE